MVIEAAPRATDSPGDGTKGAIAGEIGQNSEIFFSPRFKSVAEMAGWDEEALLIASLVVEDTPERSSSKYKRRSDLLFKSPPSSGSRRKRRVKRCPVPIPVVDLDDEEVTNNEGNKRKSTETKADPQPQEEKKTTGDEKLSEQKPSVSGSNIVLPCIDKLREELSCAICLDICFEPSTTTCGHSFCKKCLRSAADKCGKRCPKCRQLISNGRSCTVNTVLWNTIQLLFPQEVEARRAAATCDLGGKEAVSPRNPNSSRARSRNPEMAAYLERFEREDLSRLLVSAEGSWRRRRRGEVRPRQDTDAALALRLQRHEFAAAFGVPRTTTNAAATGTLSLARANLRAMASRAVQTQQRRRGQ